jgi:hypothetical protein
MVTKCTSCIGMVGCNWQINCETVRYIALCANLLLLGLLNFCTAQGKLTDTRMGEESKFLVDDLAAEP